MPAAGALVSVIVPAEADWIVKSPRLVESARRIRIDWPAAKPSSRKLPTAESPVRVTVVPAIVMSPANCRIGTCPPIASKATRSPAVTSAWPSVTMATFTLVPVAGFIVSRNW